MTTMKSLLLATALGLASMTFASAATYNLTLAAPTKAGAVSLDPGAYMLRYDGHIAYFTNVETNKSVMVVPQRDSSLVQFDRTRIELKDDAGSQRMQSIELENSNSKLEF